MTQENEPAQLDLLDWAEGRRSADVLIARAWIRDRRLFQTYGRLPTGDGKLLGFPAHRPVIDERRRA